MKYVISKNVIQYGYEWFKMIFAIWINSRYIKETASLQNAVSFVCASWFGSLTEISPRSALNPWCFISGCLKTRLSLIGKWITGTPLLNSFGLIMVVYWKTKFRVLLEKGKHGIIVNFYVKWSY